MDSDLAQDLLEGRLELGVLSGGGIVLSGDVLQVFTGGVAGADIARQLAPQPAGDLLLRPVLVLALVGLLS